MVRRVLLARGGALGSNTGLGRAHFSMVSLLEKTLVRDWTLAGIVEHPLKDNILARVWNRWRVHPNIVKQKTESSIPDWFCNPFGRPSAGRLRIPKNTDSLL